MGEQNSSKTVAMPLMRQLQAAIPRTFDYERFMLILNNMRGGIQTPNFKTIGSVIRINYQDESYGLKEASLRPSKERLIYMIEHAEDYLSDKRIDQSGDSQETIVNRKKLIAAQSSQDRNNARQDALKHISAWHNENDKKKYKGYGNQYWWALEGSSYPDLFVETDKYIFVGEVKRTEAGTTSKQKHDTGRQQLVRHIEGAFVYRDHQYGEKDKRKIISFYIVGDSWEKDYAKALSETAKGEPKFWDDSLKHFERDKIADYKQTYVGHITVGRLMELGFKF